MSKAAVALELMRRMDLTAQARVVKTAELQIGRDGSYGVVFEGVGKGLESVPLAKLLILMSANEYELYALARTIMDSKPGVREAILSDLSGDGS